MKCKRLLLPLLGVLPATAHPQLSDADSLYGIHWYGNSDPANTAAAGPTDVEAMAPGRELWVLEITHLDNLSPDPSPGSTGVQASPWERPEWFNAYGAGGHVSRVTGNGKNHSLIFRIQPNWARNVPYFEGPGDPDNDPFTRANYATAAQNAAQAFQGYCRIWQIGNEVNLTSYENKRWNTATQRYDIVWAPTPAQYAETYLAVRDAIHNVAPNMTPNTQLCLMQPVSPGAAGNPAERFMDGVEYLWRMIEAVPPAERAKLDGFGLHSYAEPGGTNDGVDGFMDGLREQIMVIDELGLGDRPLLISEFNKHMPDAANAAIAARFAQKAYQELHAWNTGAEGAFPGVPSHDVAGACWFVYHNYGGVWGDYSLYEKKSAIAGTDPNVNPWYGFQAATAGNHPRGSMAGGGSMPPADGPWWEDDFNSLDTTGPLPDWKVETTGSGNAPVASGAIRLLGAGTNGGASIRTAGYVFGNYHAETVFTITNADRPSGSANTTESNFDIRLREGSQGYSLTFFTSASDAGRRNRVILRRTNAWTQIGSFNQEIGIASGDTFRVLVDAGASTIRYRIYKNGATTPTVDWTVNDNEQKVGWVRLISYNLTEARVDSFRMGGPDWPGSTAVEEWMVY